MFLCPMCDTPIPGVDEGTGSSSAEAETFDPSVCPNCRGVVPDSDTGGSDVTLSEITPLRIDVSQPDIKPTGSGDHSTLDDRTYVPDGVSRVGRRVGHYVLRQILGEGSFGEVWLADDLKLDRPVALKLSKRLGPEADALVHEAQAAARLQHPGIVKVFDVGKVTGATGDAQAYIATEYIEGIDLKQRLQHGQPSVGDAVKLVVRVCDAVGYAHTKGVVHRDIKPANLLLDQAGDPHVSDFGLAKRISADETISSEGQVLGTAMYMSPEQAGGLTGETDHRSDLYSIGVLLFEMLTGAVPFRGNPRGIIRQKILEDAPSPRVLVPTLHKDLETICLKCLERDPVKRYQSVDELAAELKRFLNGEPIKARPIGRTARFWRWCKRRPLIAGLVGGIFFMLILFGIVVSFLYVNKAIAEENAVIAKEAKRKSHYRSQMMLASVRASQGDVTGVERVLEVFAPGSEDADLRDFAWHYHKRLVDGVSAVGHAGDYIAGVAASHDGRLVATVTKSPGISIWDTEQELLLKELGSGTTKFFALRFSPATGHLAAGGSDGVVRIWNVEAGDRPLRQLRHGPPVRRMEFSRDGQRLLTLGKKGAARVFDVDEEELIAEVPTGQFGPIDAAFMPSGEDVVILSGDGALRRWHLPERRKVWEAQTDSNPTHLAVSDDGRHVVVTSYAGNLQPVDGETGALGESLPLMWLTGDPVFAKGRPLVFVPAVNGRTAVVDVEAGRVIRESVTHNLSAGTLGRSGDGRVLAVGSGEGAVRTVRVDSLTAPTVLHLESEIRSACVLPDNRRVAVMTGDGTLVLWDTTDGKVRRLAEGMQAESHRTALVVHPQTGDLFVIDGESGLTRWSVKQGEAVDDVSVGEKLLSAVAISPDGRHLAVVDSAGFLFLFASDDLSRPLATGRVTEGQPLLDVHFIGNDRVAVASPDKQVRVFPLPQAHADGKVRGWGTPEWTVPVAASPRALAWAAKEEVLVIGTETGTMILWDLFAEKELRTVKGHTSRVNALAILPGTSAIVSAGRDRTIRLTDMTTGEPMASLHGHRRQIFTLDASVDGGLIVSGGLLGTVRIYNGRPGF